MEVKINREIREYTENIYFGLSLRQFFFSVCAIATTIILYFISSKYFGKETLSWVCILGASPFAILGFFKYNGMPAEKVIMCYIKSVLSGFFLGKSLLYIFVTTIKCALTKQSVDAIINA